MLNVEKVEDIPLNAFGSTNGWTPEERAQIAANTIDSDVFAERLFEQLESAPPLLVRGDIEGIERSIQEDQVRRAAFLFASDSGRDLVEKIKEDRDFAVIASGISEGLKDAQQRYLALADTMKQLDMRIKVALCGREDMEQVIEEGKSVLH